MSVLLVGFEMPEQDLSTDSSRKSIMNFQEISLGLTPDKTSEIKKIVKTQIHHV